MYWGQAPPLQYTRWGVKPHLFCHSERSEESGSLHMRFFAALRMTAGRWKARPAVNARLMQKLDAYPGEAFGVAIVAGTVILMFRYANGVESEHDAKIALSTAVVSL